MCKGTKQERLLGLQNKTSEFMLAYLTEKLEANFKLLKYRFPGVKCSNDSLPDVSSRSDIVSDWDQVTSTFEHVIRHQFDKTIIDRDSFPVERFACLDENKMFRRSDATFFKWMEARCGADRVWRYDNVSSWPPCVSFACLDVPYPSEDKNYQVRCELSYRFDYFLAFRISMRVKT